MVSLVPIALAAFVSMNLPPDWSLEGNNRSGYEQAPSCCGPGNSTVVTLRSREPSVMGFAALKQTVDATAYRGKRVRFSAWVRTKNVHRWSGLWLVEARGPHEVIAFDDMTDRPLSGTRPWQRVEIVLDVRPFAKLLELGAMLGGGGEIAVADPVLEEVPKTVPNTDQLAWRRGWREPPNTLPGGEFESPRDVLPWLL